MHVSTRCLTQNPGRTRSSERLHFAGNSRPRSASCGTSAAVSYANRIGFWRETHLLNTVLALPALACLNLRVRQLLSSPAWHVRTFSWQAWKCLAAAWHSVCSHFSRIGGACCRIVSTLAISGLRLLGPPGCRSYTTESTNSRPRGPPRPRPLPRPRLPRRTPARAPRQGRRQTPPPSAAPPRRRRCSVSLYAMSGR